MEEIANRYGNALYSLSLDKNKVKEYQEEVKILIKLLLDNPEFINVLGSKFLDEKKKNQMIDLTFKDFNEDIISLIKIIIKNNRHNFLLDALYSFNSYANELLNVDEGYVYSTYRLSESLINQINEKISKVEGHKVELRNMIDPSLIGGIKVVIHDHVYDGSIKQQLNQVRSNLLSKGGRVNEN